jgi:hypothetical protein
MKVVADTPVFTGSRDTYTDDLRAGEIVNARNFGSYKGVLEDKESFVIYYGDDPAYYGKTLCGTYTKNLVPVSTNELFDQDILTSDEEFQAYGDYLLLTEGWVFLHYADVLRGRDRELLPKYEPLLRDPDKESFYMASWYDGVTYRSPHDGMIVFFNAMIYIGIEGRVNNFLVKKIMKTDYGYKVSCFGPRPDYYQGYWEEAIEEWPYFKWELYTGETATLFLYIDGEYMDIYMDQIDADHKFATLIRVKEEFIRQFHNLIKTNTCDLTNVIWPRRADGSMDYPPPQLTQAVPEQPETVTVDTPPAEYEDAAAVTPIGEAIAQQPGVGLPLIVVLAAAGVAVAVGVVIFLIRRKRRP